MAIVNSFQESLQKTIENDILEQVKAAQESVISKAKDEFEVKIRSLIGSVAISLLNYYSIERIGTELVIRVQLEKKKP